MNRNERQKVTGHVEFVLYGPDGQEKDRWETDNVVTSAGKDAIADQLLAAPTLGKMTHMGLGTGSPGASALGAEIDRNALTSKTRAGAVVSMVGNWAAGDATGTLTEAGMFDAAGAGNMLLSATYTAKVKGALDTLAATWALTIA